MLPADTQQTSRSAGDHRSTQVRVAHRRSRDTVRLIFFHLASQRCLGPKGHATSYCQLNPSIPERIPKSSSGQLCRPESHPKPEHRNRRDAVPLPGSAAEVKKPRPCIDCVYPSPLDRTSLYLFTIIVSALTRHSPPQYCLMCLPPCSKLYHQDYGPNETTNMGLIAFQFVVHGQREPYVGFLDSLVVERPRPNASLLSPNRRTRNGVY